MKKSYVSFAVTFIFGLFTVFTFMSYTGGSANANQPRTGAPGGPDNGNTCTTCHGGSLNPPGGSLTLAIAGNPTTYSPGDTLDMTITVTGATSGKYGFQMTALDAGQAMAGDFIAGTGNQRRTVSSRIYIEQSGAGANGNGGVFSYKWIAPTSNVGNVTFYYVGNATNSNNSTSGDKIYASTTSLTFAPGISTDFTADDADVCTDETVIFTDNSSGATSWQWNFGAGASPATANTVGPHSVTYSTSGMKTVTLVINGGADSLVRTNYIDVTEVPTVSYTSNTVCEGEQTVFSNGTSGTGVTGFTWDFGNGDTANTINGFHTFDGCGSFPVSLTAHTNNCSETFWDTVHVICNPVAAFSFDTVCLGAATQFTILTSYDSVVYDLGDGTVSINANPVHVYTFCTDYTVTLTVYENGCSHDTTMTVPVHCNPNVDAGNDVTICAGGSVSLSPSGADRYQWMSSPSLSCINCPNPDATPTSSETFTVTGTDTTTGCSASDTVRITVANSLSATVSNDTAICEGDCVMLSASGGITYSWWPSQAVSDPTIANPTTCPDSTTTYWVEISDGVCTDTLSVTVTVNPAPVVDAGNDTTICEGDMAVLTANSPTALLFIWSNGDASNQITVGDEGCYEVIAYDFNNCFSFDSVCVTVLDLSPTLDLGADQSICIGEDPFPTLDAGSGFTSYLWSTAETTSSIATDSTASIYWVEVTDSQGCMGSDTVEVISNSFGPAIVFDHNENPLWWCGNEFPIWINPDYQSYSWSTGSTTDSATVVGVGDYGVQVVDVNGCTGTDTLHIPMCMSIGDVSGISISVFPIPARDILYIRSESATDLQEATMTLFNLLGESVTSSILRNGRGRISTDALSNGVYYLHIESEGESSSIPVLIER